MIDENTDYEIDISKVDENLKGYWWNRIRINDLFFFPKIRNIEKANVNEGDILIHKEKKEGEKFPSINYFMIINGNVLLFDNKTVKKQIEEVIVKYIKKKKILPMNCKYIKIFKNNNVQIDYKPSSHDNFAITISPKYWLNEDIKRPIDVDMNGIFMDLKNEELSIDDNDECTFTIQKIFSDELRRVGTKTKENKVFGFDAKIIDINKRKEIYLEHSKDIYLISLENGKINSENTQDEGELAFLSGCEKFSKINIKVSKLLFINCELKIGDIITFNGFYKQDKNLGDIIQNIRTIKKN